MRWPRVSWRIRNRAGGHRVFDGLAATRFADVDAFELRGVPAGQLDLALGYLGGPGGTVRAIAPGSEVSSMAAAAAMRWREASSRGLAY